LHPALFLQTVSYSISSQFGIFFNPFFMMLVYQKQNEIATPNIRCTTSNFEIETGVTASFGILF